MSLLEIVLPPKRASLGPTGGPPVDVGGAGDGVGGCAFDGTSSPRGY